MATLSFHINCECMFSQLNNEQKCMLVISPLRSLIEDQLMFLRGHNIAGCAIMEGHITRENMAGKLMILL